MIFGFKDNKCKGKVYTQEEIDNLLAAKSGTDHTHDERYYTKNESDNTQTASIEVTDTAGKANLTFRRVGKVVYVRICLTSYANQEGLFIANKPIDIPEFAKSTEGINILLFDSCLITGYSRDYENYSIVPNNINRASLKINSDGNYLFSCFKENGTTQTTDNSTDLVATYII